jgi:hypothetical protein
MANTIHTNTATRRHASISCMPAGYAAEMTGNGQAGEVPVGNPKGNTRTQPPATSAHSS